MPFSFIPSFSKGELHVLQRKITLKLFSLKIGPCLVGFIIQGRKQEVSIAVFPF